MAFDGIYLHLLCDELNEKLNNAKIEKIYQPSKTEFVFALRTRTAGYKLLLSASGQNPRINLTKTAPENPPDPPMLCMLFRKHLAGGTLTGIEQVGFDRIVKLCFEATNEIGDRVKRCVIVEIMAQYSNIILVDENGIIIDSVKKVDASKSSVRQILPSLGYEYPPGQDKYDIILNSADGIISRVLEYKNKALSSALLSVIQGASPSLCKELAYRVCADDCTVENLSEDKIRRLSFEINNLKSVIENHTVSPCIIKDIEGRYIEFSFCPFVRFGKDAVYESYGDLSEAADEFYYERERFARTKSKAEDLFKTVNNLIERVTKKINNQTAELRECAERETKRIYAELINVNLYRLKKGAYEYELENYYDNNNTVKIPVKPNLTPSQNSQRYYKEYRKAQTAEKMLTKLIDEGKETLDYLFTVLDEMNRADTEKELTEIRLELSDGGYIKRKTGSKNKKASPMPPLKFKVADGFYVLVGRNNLQNDKLSLKTASKNDIWFHIQKAPGSHTVLVCDGREPTERAMEQAAEIAAYYSSGRDGGNAVIDYTPVKNLKKPNGAKPGFVIYHIYNSVVVKPKKPDKEDEVK